MVICFDAEPKLLPLPLLQQFEEVNHEGIANAHTLWQCIVCNPTSSSLTYGYAVAYQANCKGYFDIIVHLHTL
jgi:hypothetical protein